MTKNSDNSLCTCTGVIYRKWNYICLHWCWITKHWA